MTVSLKLSVGHLRIGPKWLGGPHTHEACLEPLTVLINLPAGPLSPPDPLPSTDPLEPSPFQTNSPRLEMSPEPKWQSVSVQTPSLLCLLQDREDCPPTGPPETLAIFWAYRLFQDHYTFTLMCFFLRLTLPLHAILSSWLGPSPLSSELRDHGPWQAWNAFQNPCDLRSPFTSATHPPSKPAPRTAPLWNSKL